MPCSVVPPHLLERLQLHPHAGVRHAATRTLATDRALRARPAPLHATPANRVGGCQRVIFDCGGTEDLPGKIRRVESQPTRGEADAEVDRAYDAQGTTHDFFNGVFGLTSITIGGELYGSVHYGDHYDNAFWAGIQIVYGDGDGIVFRSFTTCLDVIAHELTHGLLQRQGTHDYAGETGALVESIADVFGSLVKQWSLGQSADAADWIIGSGLFTAAVQGVGLRSLAAPGTAYDDPLLGKDPQPSHMRDYVDPKDDHADVHVNSGIPNHAFYLFATELGGNAWETAGHIWHEAMRSGLTAERCSFAKFAGATFEAAHSYGPNVHAALANAWDAVGITSRRSARSATGD
jgi:Zn-dependent metalloprotease